MVKKCIYITYVFLLSIALQNSYSQSKTLRFEHLTTKSELPRNQVYSLLQDHIGYIWVGTGDGLSRYDGYRFNNFNDKTTNLTGKHITNIYEDSELNLWVATNKGFSKFDKATNSFENFVLDSTAVSKEKNFWATSIYEDLNNQFWVGSQKGLFLFNRQTKKVSNNWSSHPLKKKLDKSRVTTIFQDSKKRLWIGTLNKGVFLISFNLNKEIERISHFAHNSEDSISHNKIDDIKEDKNGAIWFATRGGLNKLNEKNKLNPEEYTFKKIKNPYKKDIAYLDMINSITIDHDNNLFVGYINGMYYLPDGSNTLENIDIITNNPQLKHNYGMNTQFIDKSGVLWLTSSNGIYKYDLFLLKFNTYRANQNNPESRRQNLVWSILKDQDKHVWIGTSYGLNKLVWNDKDNKYDYLHIPNNTEETSDKNKYSIISIIEFDKNNLIISKRDGLFKFNKQRLTFTKIPFPINTIPNKMCWGEKDILWIGTNKGILKYDTHKQKYKEYKIPSGIGNNWTHTIHVDQQKRIWVGTISGINVFHPKEEKFYFIETNSTSEYKSVWAIYGDKDGSIWYGKWGDGLAHIIPNGKKQNFIDGYEIEEFHVKDGLANEYIYAVLPDEDENIWVSTNMGLSKLDIKTNQFENYTADEGLQSNEFNSGAYYKAADGELFFGGPSGINSFYPSTIFKNKKNPNVIITNVVVNGKEMSIFSSETKTTSEKIVLEHDQNPIKFEFSTLTYSNSLKNKYKIQLENYDKNWVTIDHNSSITYSKLSPGKYTFRVKGYRNNGTWNENTTSLGIEITPPYWKTWWFYTLYVLFVLGVIFLVFTLRLRRVKLKERKEYFKKQNEEKKVIIKEIHHRIKNNLQVVISLLRLQSAKIKDEKVLDMFKESQKRIFSMALLHEKMQQEHDVETIDVQEHFKSLIKNLIKTYDLGKNIKLDINIEKIDFGMQTLTPLGLIVNEIITNSLKYAFEGRDNGTIKVHLQPANELTYEMEIADDGVGYSKDKESTGIGKKLIKIFIKQLNGTIKRVDKNGTAYKITFEEIDHT